MTQSTSNIYDAHIQGKEIVSEGGHPIKILSYDFSYVYKGRDIRYGLVVLHKLPGLTDRVGVHNSEGYILCSEGCVSEFNLKVKPTVHEAWVNVYLCPHTKRVYASNETYSSMGKAKRYANTENYIKTIKIHEWEE